MSRLILPSITLGASISVSSDDLSKLEQLVPSNHSIKFKTSNGAGDTADTIIYTLPFGFDLSAININDVDLFHGSTTGLETEETLSASPNETDWGLDINELTISLSHPTNTDIGDINPDDFVVMLIGTNANGGLNQIKNASAGNYTISIAGTFGDSGLIPITILEDDQIYAEANIIPRISLTLSSNNSSFGQINESLLGTVVTSSPDITLTISTNHSNGYSVYVYDLGNGTSPGIYNSSLGILLGSATSNLDNNINLDAIIAGYGIQAECISGCNTDTEITERFRVKDNTIAGLERTPGVKLIEYGTYLEEEHIVRIRHKIKVSEYTRSGNYVDNITYVATSRY